MNDGHEPAVAAASTNRLETFIKTHGVLPSIIAAGGALATLGAIIPCIHVEGMMGNGTACSFTMIGLGSYGLLALIAPIVLAIFPIMLKRYAHLTNVAYGIACALFGIFFAVWLLASTLMNLIGGAVGFSFGFYLTLIGYAVLVVAYYRLNDTRLESTLTTAPA